jgi:ribosome-binding protein aMBF1 (putative translation factor)
MKKCKLCGVPTRFVFNIKLNATPICNDCADSIFLQQAKWYTDLSKKYARKSNKNM